MNQKNEKLRFVVYSAIFTAIVFVATYAVQIPLPGLANGGLIHLGNVALFSISILFGKKYGAVSAAFGMALFDLLSPWVIWAPGTFIIRGIMAYAVGRIAEGGGSKKSVFRTLLAMILPSIWMIAGYFGYNLLLYGDYPAAVASLPGDLIQIGMGILISLPIIQTLTSTGMDLKLRNMAQISTKVEESVSRV